MALIWNNIEENGSSLEALKKIEIDDIKGLLLEKESDIKDVGVYGVRYQLKRFAGIDPNIILNKCTIEHGLSLEKYVYQPEVLHPVSHILTYSPYREKVLQELTDFTPVAIGPYIAYAENYRTETVIEEKKRALGRVLLVMPVHSVLQIELAFDFERLFQEIERVKTKFDTVWICLHNGDLERDLWKLYRKRGYEVVSAGYWRSPYFLSRLKYILSLSDALLVNGFTTGMVYAMYMGRPIHWMWEKIERNVNSKISWDNGNQLETTMNEEVYKLFDNDQFMITPEQIRFGEYMFGLNCVKSKEEMRELLLSLTRTVR